MGHESQFLYVELQQKSSIYNKHTDAYPQFALILRRLRSVFYWSTVTLLIGSLTRILMPWPIEAWQFADVEEIGRDLLYQNSGPVGITAVENIHKAESFYYPSRCRGTLHFNSELRHWYLLFIEAIRLLQAAWNSYPWTPIRFVLNIGISWWMRGSGMLPLNRVIESIKTWSNYYDKKTPFIDVTVVPHCKAVYPYMAAYVSIWKDTVAHVDVVI